MNKNKPSTISLSNYIATLKKQSLTQEQVFEHYFRLIGEYPFVRQLLNKHLDKSLIGRLESGDNMSKTELSSLQKSFTSVLIFLEQEVERENKNAKDLVEQKENVVTTASDLREKTNAGYRSIAGATLWQEATGGRKNRTQREFIHKLVYGGLFNKLPDLEKASLEKELYTSLEHSHFSKNEVAISLQKVLTTQHVRFINQSPEVVTYVTSLIENSSALHSEPRLPEPPKSDPSYAAFWQTEIQKDIATAYVEALRETEYFNQVNRFMVASIKELENDAKKPVDERVILDPNIYVVTTSLKTNEFIEMYAQQREAGLAEPPEEVIQQWIKEKIQDSVKTSNVMSASLAMYVDPEISKVSVINIMEQQLVSHYGVKSVDKLPPEAQIILKSFASRFSGGSDNAPQLGSNLSEGEILRRVTLASLVELDNNPKLAQKILGKAFVESNIYKQLIADAKKDLSDIVPVENSSLLSLLFKNKEDAEKALGVQISDKLFKSKITPEISTHFLQSFNALSNALESNNPLFSIKSKEGLQLISSLKGVPRNSQQAFLKLAFASLDPIKQRNFLEFLKNIQLDELTPELKKAGLLKFAQELGLSVDKPMGKIQLTMLGIDTAIRYANLAYLMATRPGAALMMIISYGAQRAVRWALKNSAGWFAKKAMTKAVVKLGVGLVSKLASRSAIVAIFSAGGPLGTIAGLVVSFFADKIVSLLKKPAKKMMWLILFLVLAPFLYSFSVPINLNPRDVSRRLIVEELGGGSNKQVVNSKYIQVEKSASRQSFTNADVGSVEYTIRITANGSDLTNITLSDTFSVYASGQHPNPAPPAPSGVPTSLKSGESFSQKYSVSLVGLRDASVNNVLAVEAMVSATQTTEKSATSTTVTVGNPPTGCFVFDGWPPEDEALEKQVAAAMAAQQPAYMTKLCAGGPIKLIWKASSPYGYGGCVSNGCVGSANFSNAIAIYKRNGLGNFNNAFYTLTHESGHIYSFRNGAILSSFLSSVPRVKICTYPFSNDIKYEPFAEAVALYYGSSANGRSSCMVGGSLQTGYPEHWRFMNDIVFK